MLANDFVGKRVCTEYTKKVRKNWKTHKNCKMYYIVHWNSTNLFLLFCFCFYRLAEKRKVTPWTQPLTKWPKRPGTCEDRWVLARNVSDLLLMKTSFFFLINTPLTMTFTIYFFYCHYKKRNTSNIPVHLSAISKDQVTVMYFFK